MKEKQGMHEEVKKPRISILTPTYNRENTILRSVKSSLRNNPYEVIVIDDGSLDNTKKILEGLPIIYHKLESNSGVNVARNEGVKRASGDYILLIDSDDVLAENSLDEVYKQGGDLKEVNFFGTLELKTKKKMYFLDEKKKMYSYKDWLEQKKIRGEFTPLIRKDVFDKNLFDEDRFCFEGFFWNRIIKKYGVLGIDATLRLYSFEEENRVSNDLLKIEKAEKRYEDYKKYIDEFGDDILRFKLYDTYGDLLFKCGFYAFSSGKGGRGYLKKSLKYKKDPVFFITLLLSYLGRSVFIRTYSIYLRIKKL